MKKCFVCIGVMLASMMPEAAGLSQVTPFSGRGRCVRAPLTVGAATNVAHCATVGSTNAVDLLKLTDPELSRPAFLSATKGMKEDDIRKLCINLRFKYVRAARLNMAYAACDEYMTLLLLKVALQHSIDLRKAASDIDVMASAAKKKFDKGLSVGGSSFAPVSTEAQRLEKIKVKSNLVGMRYMVEAMTRMSTRQDLLEQAKEKVDAAKKNSNPQEKALLLREARDLLEKAKSIQ